MKKILASLFVIINLSMINPTKKYWQCVYRGYRQYNTANVNNTDGTIIVEIVEADSKLNAQNIFNKYLGKDKDLKKLTIALYSIYEIEERFILKK